MTQKKDKRWKMNTYKLIPVTKNVKSDQAAQKQIDKFMDTVDTNYLVNFGYTKDQVLAENDIKFNSLEEMETKHEDTHINESILSEEILEDQKKNRIDHMTYLPGMEDIGSEILDQVVTAMEAYDYNTYTAEDVKRALAHAERTPEDSGVIVTGSTAISGGNSAGSADRDEKTFW